MRKAISLPDSMAFWAPAGTLIVFLAAITLSSSIVYWGSKRIIEEDNLSQISYLLLSLKARAELDIAKGDYEKTHQDISVMGTIPEVREVAVTDENGIIILANRFAIQSLKIDTVSQYSSAQQRKEAKQLKPIQFFVSPDKNTVEAFLSYSLPSQGELRSSKRGLIFLSYNLQYSEQKLINYVSQKLLVFWLAAALLISIVILLLRIYLLTPVKRLIVQANLITKGDYTGFVDTSGCLEVSALAESLNEIRNAIAYQIAELEQVREKLESRVKLRTAELNNANVKYKHAQTLGRLGHWEINLDTGVCEFSQEAYDIIGIKYGTPVVPVSLFGLSDDSPAVLNERLSGILDKAVPFSDLNYQITVGNDVRYIRLVAEKITAEEQPVTKVIGIVQDITGQKVKENSLRENQARMQAIIDTAADAIIVIDTNGVIQEFSPAACSIFGYSKAEVTGKNVSMLMPEPNRSQHDGYLTTYYKTGEQKVVNNKREVVAQRKNGELFPIDLAVAETKIGKKNCFTALIRDITSRKNNEKVILNAMQEAQSATRAKSAFLANMSHEIRTPMNAIIGLSHLALNAAPEPRQKSYLDKIRRSAESLLRILNDILDLSKIEAGKLEIESTLFRLEDVIAQVQSIVAVRSQEKRINLTIDMPPDTPTALIGDPLRLAQVLLNLSGNAVKFTPQNGTIAIAVTASERTATEVTLLFSVTDTGIGISEHQQEKLFTAFSQADTSTTREFGGTGLGLAISKNLVTMMGGTIGFESVKDQGSRFYFTITCAVQQGKPSERLSNLSRTNEVVIEQIKRLDNIKVLLVEDNDFNQEIAEELLCDIGIEVVTANNGQEALDILSASVGNVAPFDLIFMDCQMPVMDGYKATRKIRAMDSVADIPVIALTANVMQHDIKNIKACGMNDYLAKPLDISLLYTKIHGWLSNKNVAVATPAENTADTGTHEALSHLLSDESGVDLEACLKHVHNDMALLQKMFAKFKTQQQVFGSRIREALHQEDRESAIRQAHTLKGQAGYLGLVTVSACAGELENVLASQQENPEQHITAVEQAINQVIQVFENVWQEAD